MADNKNLSKNIELNVTLNTSDAEQKLSKLSAEWDSLNSKLDSPVRRRNPRSAEKPMVTNVQDLISEKLFGKKGVSFKIGALKPLLDEEHLRQVESSLRVSVSEAIKNLSTAMEDGIMESIGNVDQMAQEIADTLGQKFSNSGIASKVKNYDKSSPGISEVINAKTKEDNISATDSLINSLNKLNNGISLSDEEIALFTKDIKDFGTEAVVTSAAFVNAFVQVMEEAKNLDGMLSASNPTRNKISEPLKTSPLFSDKEAYQATKEEQDNIRKYMQVLVEKYGKDGEEAVKRVLEKMIAKVFVDPVLEAAMKARLSTFTGSSGGKAEAMSGKVGSADIVEGAFGTEGLNMYADEAMRAAIAAKELEAGFEQGTAAMHLFSQYSEKFGKDLESLTQADMPETIDLEAMKKSMVGTFEFAGAQFSAFGANIPEQIALPLQQAFDNLGLLGKGFVKDYKSIFEKELNSVLGNDAKQSNVKTNLRAEVGKQESAANLQINKMLSDSMRKYGDVLGPEMVQAIVQMIKDAGGDASQITASWDNEFDSTFKALTTSIYEAGITVKGAGDEFVDLVKMIHLPKAGEKFPAIKDMVKNSEQLRQRGADIGIDPAEFGTQGDAQKNILEYRDKLQKVIAAIKMLDDLGIMMVGSNLAQADFGALVKTVEKLNEQLHKLGKDDLKLAVPDNLTNIADFTKINDVIKAKVGKGFQIDEITELIFGPGVKAGAEKGANTLGAMFTRAFNENIANIQARFGDRVRPTAGGFVAKADTGKELPAHTAVSDTRISLVLFEAIKKAADAMGVAVQMSEQFRTPTYGKNGESAPYSISARKDFPSAFIGSSNLPQQTSDTEALSQAIDDLTSVTLEQRQAEADLAVEQVNAGDKIEKATKARKDSKDAAVAARKESIAYQRAEEKSAAVTALAAEAQEKLSGAYSSETVRYFIKALTDLQKSVTGTSAGSAKLRKDISETIGAIGKLAKGGTLQATPINVDKQEAYSAQKRIESLAFSYDELRKAELASAETTDEANKRKTQSGKGYYNTQVQIDNGLIGSTKRYTDAVAAEMASGTKDSVASADTRIFAIEREAKARKDASETIKRSFKEQVDAEKAVQKATKDSLNTWVTGRYALYDVGNAYQNVSRNMFMAARRIFDLTQAYRSYETAFTSVERAMQLDINSQGAVELKDAFIELSQRIPVAFEELSRIATLGAQMGISAGGIVQFTETVSKFASITGISADEVAQKFGRIAELANIDSSQFANLGSAVAYAGVNAVATESEILSLSESIAAVSNQVGMTAPDVVGLATSLASIGIPAEQARGVFTRVFADIDRAVASGGKSLSTFADVAGMSVKDFSAAWGQQGESYGVFRAMLGGISTAENMTKTFDALNITETREVNTLTRLAKNLNVVDQAAGDATASFSDAKFLGDSFEKTVDNLDSKILMFQSTLKSLGEEMMKGLAPAFGGLIEAMSGIAKFAKEMAKSPFMQGFAGASIGIIGIVGIFTGLTAVLAKVTAQIYAFRVAMIQSATDPTATAGITSKIKQLVGFSSSLVEMRDELKRADSSVRGAVTPVNFRTQDTLADFRKGYAERKKMLMDTANIYLATGSKMADMDEKAFAKAKLSNDQRVAFAREEADAITELQRARQAQIEKEVAAGTAHDSATMKYLENEKIRYEWTTKNGKRIAQAFSMEQVMWAKEVTAGKLMVSQQEQITAKRIMDADAITMQTKAASIASKGLVGLGSRLLGGLGAIGTIASLLTMVTGLIGGLVTAAQEAAKIDIAGSGFGLEAVRDAIKQDTEAWIKNGDAISTHRAQYKTTQAVTSDAAKTMNALAGEVDGASSSMKTLEETTRSTTVAFGDSLKTLLINSILANDKIKELMKTGSDFISLIEGLQTGDRGFVEQVLGSPEEAQAAINNIDKKLEEIQKKKDYILSNPDLYTGTESVELIKNLDKEREGYNALRATAVEARKTLKEAANQAILADMAAGYSKPFFGLDAAIKNAVKTGKGMAKVMKDIALAALKISGGAMSKDLFNKISSAKSVEEMLKFLKAAHVAIIAKKKLEYKGGNPDRINVSGLEDAIKNTELLAKSYSAAGDASANLDKSGSGAETLAEKMKRLLDSVFASTNALINMNSAVRGLGASMAGGNSWSAYTEQGAKNLGALQSALGAIAEKGGKNAVKSLQLFRDALKQSGAGAPALAKVDAYIKKLGGDSTLTKKQLEALKKGNISLYNSFKKLLKEGIEGTSNGLRTLGDYASEVAGIMRDAFNFKFGVQSSLDSLTSAWLSLNDAVQQAKDSLAETNATIYELTANQSSLEMQLKIALEYGDTINADLIRAELEKNKVALEKAKAEAEKLKNATNLTGNDETSIGNREKMRGMVQNYISYLEQLAASGMSETELAAQADKLGKEFMDNAIAAGFKAEDIQQYADTVGSSFKTIIERVNKGTTLKVDTDPALRALEEFSKKANKALKKIGTVTIEVSSSVDGTSTKKKALGGLITGPGSSTSDSIPAMLSNGEYVVRASAVSAYGVDFLNSLNQQRVSFDTRVQAQPIQTGGSDSQIVYLSPEDRQLLRAAIDRPVNLYTENTKIAQSANAGNVLLARRGVK